MNFKKIKESPYFTIFLQFTVAWIALHKTLSFFFWGDDFSILYNASLKICPFYWPFNSYCPVFNWIYSLFGFNPMPYFVLAFGLRVLVGFTFYLFGKEIIGKIPALLLSLLVISVGAEDDMLTFYAISENVALSLLFFTLWSLLKISGKKLLFLFAGLASFLISMVFFPIYSTGHVFIAGLIGAIYLYKRISRRLFFVSAIIVAVIFSYTYFLVPFSQSGKLLLFWDRAGGHVIDKDFLTLKVRNYFISTGSFVLTDYLDAKLPTRVRTGKGGGARMIFGALFNIILVWWILKNRKKGGAYIIGIVGFFWIVTQYLPKGLVTINGLANTDRHFFYPYIGFVLALGAFTNLKKFWSAGILLLLIFNLYQTNVFFGHFSNLNLKRAYFYQQLRTEVGRLKGSGVFYLDAPRGQLAQELGDFVRTGMHPTESSIAVALGKRMEDIKVVSESDDLARKIKNHEVSPGSFFSFYYNGHSLVDTTSQSRELLVMSSPISGVGVEGESKPIFNEDKDGSFFSRQADINFEISQFRGLLPSVLSLRVASSIPEIPLPLIRKCEGCVYNKNELTESLDFNLLSRRIKSEAVAFVTGTSENTAAENLLDDSLDTPWIADRDWFLGGRPVIIIKFKNKVSVGGIVVTTAAHTRKPKDVEIWLDGEKIKNKKVEEKNDTLRVVFTDIHGSEMKIKIMATYSDRPQIDELNFVPAGFQNFDLNIAKKYEESPAAFIKTEGDKQLLKDYLLAGTDICLKWASVKYGSGQIGLRLIPDGQAHSYDLLLPTMGIDEPHFSLGCFNVPIDVNLLSARARFLGNDKNDVVGIKRED